MAKPLRPYVRGGGFYPSRKYTPLVYPGGYTTRHASVWPHDPLNTFTGDIVQFNTIRSMPIKSLKVNMAPIQDLHGYDSPWPAGGGKNKLKNLQTTQTISGVTFTVNSDGSVLVNGTASELVVFSLNDVLGDYLENGVNYILNGSPTNPDPTKWKLRVYNIGDSIDTGSGVLFTFDSSSTTKKCDIVVYSGTTMNNVLIKPMIRLPSVADATFAPYSNICPISGWMGVSVWRDGKNFVDDTIFRYSGVSRRTSGTGANELREFINSLPSGTYTVAFDAVVDAVGDSTKNWEFGFYGTSTFGTINSIINKVNPAVGSVYRPSVTITKPDGGVINTLYVYAASSSANDLATISKFQLELGSTATDYEPFRGNSYSVTWEDEVGTVYGGTVDLVSGVLTVTGVLEELKNVSDNILSSGLHLDSFNKTNGSVGVVGNVTRIAFSIDSSTAYNRVSSSYDYKMCNMAKHYFSYNDPSVHWYRNTVLYVFLPTELVGTTSESVFDYLVSIKDTTPLSFWIPFITPITYQLTPQQITALKGYNAVWSDAGPVEVTAYGTLIAEPDVQPLQAMNLLLGGAYRNNHTPEDVSDEEALNIITGGADR